jgi:hypothetical protein
MTKPFVFLSYSQQDHAQATALEGSLRKLGLPVWRDKRSIDAGARWTEAIEAGIRGSRGAVVLITTSSARSKWVIYEYAFAKGAGVPVIAVKTRSASVPSSIRQFQMIDYTNPRSVAKRIDAGLSNLSRVVGQNRASSAPNLIAKFQEVNGQPATASKGKIPELLIEMWLEQVPKETRSVAFEIPDKGFIDRKWTTKRAPRGANVERAFLCDDMRSYGDIELWARGIGRGSGNWSSSWHLYQALMRYYRGRPISAGVRAALRQIREN